jgi:hypothetical protein
MNARPRFSSPLILALLCGCAGEVRLSTGPLQPYQFEVTNRLLAPITIAIDDNVTAIIRNGNSTGIIAASSAQWLTWTSAKPADMHGAEIPDDIRKQRIGVPAIRLALEITNVINDTTYITASIFNETTSDASIGIFDGTSVACVSWLPAKSGAVHGFTQTGYYRLHAATEIRAYRFGSDCTGTFVAWPRTLLASFEPKSGLVTLVLNAAP